MTDDAATMTGTGEGTGSDDSRDATAGKRHSPARPLESRPSEPPIGTVDRIQWLAWQLSIEMARMNWHHRSEWYAVNRIWHESDKATR